MRIDHYPPSEIPKPTDRPDAIAGSASFGRIGRCRPAPIAEVAPLSLRLQAGARTHRQRIVGDLVAAAVRAVAASVRGLADTWERQREARGAARALRELASGPNEILSDALDIERVVETVHLRAAPAHHPLRLS